MDYCQPGPDDAEEAVPSPFFEVTFRNLHDSFKMDVLCIQADSPAEAEAWIASINELRCATVLSFLSHFSPLPSHFCHTFLSYYHLFSHFSQGRRG